MSIRDELRAAALASVRRSEGEPDPLREMIPGDGDAAWHILWEVEQITGTTTHHRPPFGESLNTAPASRAALRRWALKAQENAR